MKANKIIIIALVVLVLASIFIYIQRRKARPDENVIDVIFSKLGLGSKKKPGVIETSKTARKEDSDDYKFFTNSGWGEGFLQQFSPYDLKIFRQYFEQYRQKGIKIQPTDPIYKDVIRINTYAKIFQDLPSI